MVTVGKVSYNNRMFNGFIGVFLLFCLNAHICDASEISFVVNPNCTSETTDCSQPWIVYGKQENATFTVHYLWSAKNIPSFLMAYSIPGVDIQINWSDFTAGKPGSIYFSTVPETLFGMSFQRLILFNDIKDTGTLDNIPEEDKKYANLADFEWALDPNKNITAEECTFSFYSTSYNKKPLPKNTKISFSVTSYGTSGRSSELPHLLTTDYSSHLEVVLDNLVIDLDNNTFSSTHHHGKDDVVPISGFDHPRWALDTIIVSDDQPYYGEEGFIYENKKSLDDEYTPGVFDLTSITTEAARKPSASPSLGGYLQWRPVCYLTTDKDVKDSTYPNFNTSLPPIDEEHKKLTENSLFYALFGEQIVNLLGTQTPIAFGLSNDKFYTEFNYTEWTFAMGLGAPPEESFSTVIIIVISVAVGVPCTLFIAGGAYLLFKRMRRRGEMNLLNEE